VTPAAFGKRLDAIEAAVAALAPDLNLEARLAAVPWLAWATTPELIELDHFYRRAESEGAELTPADEARALSIAYAAEARGLAGEPAEDQKESPYAGR
jgi:hypothetical protein